MVFLSQFSWKWIYAPLRTIYKLKKQLRTKKYCGALRTGKKNSLEFHLGTGPPLSFLRTVITLGYLFFAVFYSWVIRYILKLILVMFQTNFGYVLGEIYQKKK